MNYLALCQRTRQEAAIAGTGPAAVSAQTGENRRIVDWVNSAYEDIQLKHKEWLWLRGEFSFNSVAGDYDYTADDAGITTRFREWERNSIHAYKTSIGLTDDVALPFIGYESYRRLYIIGYQTSVRPSCISVGPTQKLLLGPKPDDIYTVQGEYYKSVQTLAADADIPEMPTQFHMAIVYRALMMYARYNAAGEIYADAEANYKRFIRLMETEQLPTLEMADPLI